MKTVDLILNSLSFVVFLLLNIRLQIWPKNPAFITELFNKIDVKLCGSVADDVKLHDIIQ